MTKTLRYTDAVHCFFRRCPSERIDVIATKISATEIALRPRGLITFNFGRKLLTKMVKTQNGTYFETRVFNVPVITIKTASINRYFVHFMLMSAGRVFTYYDDSMSKVRIKIKG